MKFCFAQMQVRGHRLSTERGHFFVYISTELKFQERFFFFLNLSSIATFTCHSETICFISKNWLRSYIMNIWNLIEVFLLFTVTVIKGNKAMIPLLPPPPPHKNEILCCTGTRSRQVKMVSLKGENGCSK